jgi:hypothetical protein
MTHYRIMRWSLAAAAIVAAGALFAATATNIMAQEGGGPTLRVVAPTEEVKEGDDAIPFEIHIDNVENLASFQFVMQYRDDVFEFAGAQQGQFLGSTERDVVCNEPITDAGSARFSCVTLRPEPAGPSGAGHLATITLNAVGSGSTDVTLDRIRLLRVDEEATDIPNVVVEPATIDVAATSSTNWLMWGGIAVAAILVVGGGGAFAAMRMRNGSPAPTKVESPQ